MHARGRRILSGVALITATTGYLADWNRTHLFNPAWTPHAKFHDAWTILMGTGLGTSSLIFVRKGNPELAALLPAIFWATQLGSIALPGTAGLESEFPELIPTIAGIRLNETLASMLMLAATAVGYQIARQPSGE